MLWLLVFLRFAVLQKHFVEYIILANGVKFYAIINTGENKYFPIKRGGGWGQNSLTFSPGYMVDGSYSVVFSTRAISARSATLQPRAQCLTLSVTSGEWSGRNDYPTLSCSPSASRRDE